MELLNTKKWAPFGFRDESGKPKDGAPLLRYRTATGSTKVKLETKISRICAEYVEEYTGELEQALARLKAARAHTDEESEGSLEELQHRVDTMRRMVSLYEGESLKAAGSTNEGFALIMETCIEHVSSVHNLTWSGEALKWGDLPTESDDEDEPSKRGVIDRLGEHGADEAHLAVLDLYHSVTTGLTGEQKKTWIRSLNSGTATESTGDATAPSAQDKPGSTTSDEPEPTSTPGTDSDATATSAKAP